MTTFLGTVLGDIAFDAVISEDIVASSVVTANPIETGAEVNDHIYTVPKQYTLVGGVSNTPLQVSDSDIFTAATNQIGDSRGAGRRVAAWGILNQLHDAGEAFTVQAFLETIPNMVITSISVPNEANLSGSAIFTATLQQIIIVETQETEIPASQLEGSQTKGQATSSVDKGKVTKEEIEDPSLALQILHLLGLTQ